jgi:hypothetical protein
MDIKVDETVILDQEAFLDQQYVEEVFTSMSPEGEGYVRLRLQGGKFGKVLGLRQYFTKGQIAETSPYERLAIVRGMVRQFIRETPGFEGNPGLALWCRLVDEGKM